MTLGPVLLFCPADRPERFGKAAAAADAVILDLEDAVSLDAKDSARRSVVESRLDPATTIVRVNPRSSGHLEKDLAALADTAYRTVMLAKAESLDDLAAVAGFDVIALCETPLGVRNAAVLADQQGVVGLTWGAEDLVAAMGGSSSRQADGRYRAFAMHARSHVLISATSAGKAAWDTVHVDIADDDGLRDEAEDAAASGFSGALCIHPRQAAIIRDAFQPSATRLEWARGVLAAAEAARNGVFAYEGRMIDEPILRQARAVLEHH
jgi:citrate lyase subunit beta/citryl-CoA lyase